jgi:arylsulfatase A
MCWNRRLVCAAVILVAGFLSLAQTTAAGAAEQRPPNIIVMMADDLGAHELGCYGHSEHRTPHLDRLARTGVQFDTCYSTPICHPTRFEIMTGQYGHHNKVYHFPGRPGGPKSGSPEDDIARHRTFAQVLKPCGYATAQAGKWQLTGAVPKLVVECGFDEYCMWAYKHNLPPGVEHGGGWEGAKGGKTCRYWHPSIVKNGEYLPTKPDDYGPDIFTDSVIDFARRHQDEPFFIYYPMALTHAPYYPTPDQQPTEDQKFVHSKANWQANVEYTDKIVGRIVAALDELGLRENTILFFTGDNGTGGNGKGQTTEMGARVPMIVNCPGLVKSIGRSRELVDLSDVLPTLVELVGAELPGDRPIDGRSYAPLLKGESFSPRDWIYAYLGGRRVVRTKRWLLENNSPKHFGQLYDCGDCRDGSKYRDVTDSQDPEAVAARGLMEEILADKPVPDVSDHVPVKRNKRGGKKAGNQKRGKSGQKPA